MRSAESNTPLASPRAWPCPEPVPPSLQLLEDMKAADVQPDVITYTALIGAAGRAGEWRGALGYLTKMQATGVAPNLYTYSRSPPPSAPGGPACDSVCLFWGDMRVIVIATPTPGLDAQRLKFC